MSALARLVSSISRFLTPEQARTDPRRNVITRALGTGQVWEPDVWVLPARAGDRLVLCSDGLNAVMKPAAIESLLRSDAELDEIAQTLVRATLKRGAPDNVTVVVLEVVDAADLG